LSFGLEFRGEDCNIYIWEAAGSRGFEALIEVANPLPDNSANADFFGVSFDEEPAIDDLYFAIEALYAP
jgi:hypothetical protein